MRVVINYYNVLLENALSVNLSHLDGKAFRKLEDQSVKPLAWSVPSPLRFSPLRFAPGVPLHFRDNKDRRELSFSYGHNSNVERKNQPV
jgi:hypothetical protein